MISSNKLLFHKRPPLGTAEDASADILRARMLGRDSVPRGVRLDIGYAFVEDKKQLLARIAKLEAGLTKE